MAALTVEEVGKGLPGREFADLAVALGADHPGAGWLLAGQRRRLRVGGPPGGEAALLLARRGGQPVARLTAHRQADGEGCFGFLAVAGPGDLDAVQALLAAAAAWLAERGPVTVIGPLSWTAAEEAGVMVAGNEQAAVTGRAWNPVWHGALLEAAGLVVAEEMASYRLPATATATGARAVPMLAPAPLAVPSDLALRRPRSSSCRPGNGWVGGGGPRRGRRPGPSRRRSRCVVHGPPGAAPGLGRLRGHGLGRPARGPHSWPVRRRRPRRLPVGAQPLGARRPSPRDAPPPLPCRADSARGRRDAR